MIKLRMCDEDRDEYGGPEVLTFDVRELLDERAQTLEEYEATIGMPITDLVTVGRRTARGVRATLWLARRRAGLVDAWEDFNPRVLRVTPVEDTDVDPPDSATPKSSEAEESEPS